MIIPVCLYVPSLFLMWQGQMLKALGEKNYAFILDPPNRLLWLELRIKKYQHIIIATTRVNKSGQTSGSVFVFNFFIIVYNAEAMFILLSYLADGLVIHFRMYIKFKPKKRTN